LNRVFDFLADAYKTSALAKTRLGMDQTHFYTMATALLNSELVEDNSAHELAEALTAFGLAIDGTPVFKSKAYSKLINDYRELSAKQTSDVSRRARREQLFADAVKMGLELKA
jgi:hypothetical protein